MIPMGLGTALMVKISETGSQNPLVDKVKKDQEMVQQSGLTGEAPVPAGMGKTLRPKKPKDVMPKKKKKQSGMKDSSKLVPKVPKAPKLPK